MRSKRFWVRFEPSCGGSVKTGKFGMKASLKRGKKLPAMQARGSRSWKGIQGLRDWFKWSLPLPPPLSLEKNYHILTWSGKYILVYLRGTFSHHFDVHVSGIHLNSHRNPSPTCRCYGNHAWLRRIDLINIYNRKSPSEFTQFKCDV